MKRVSLFVALTLATATPFSYATEVVSTERDHSVGYGAGGVVGVMVGAALGGPFGAIAGAALGALGALGGGAVQQATGLSENAYIVRHADGSTERFRSPNAEFETGDPVQVQGIRLVPASASSR
ncbi:hypothetical protein [Pseudomonas paraeruginosa]|uniref:hypothetical protein n=1 Tax=Pseudomonas paraeruginosa TaxID=2994495 RepID=UPI0039FC4E33